MTIIHKSGNILDATENIIIHQVNCEGVMGAGLAKQLRNKWPIIYTEYKKLCDENRIKFMLLGKVQYIKVDEKKYVANMFSQLGIGTDKIQTIYSDMKKVDADLSPSSASLDVFGFNLFIFSYEQYIKLCEELDNDPRYYSKSHIRN